MRPQSFLAALRGALPRRGAAQATGFTFAAGRSAPHAGPKSFRFAFGPQQQARQSHSNTVVSTSLRSTLFRPITIILIIAPFLSGYLGVWQVQRLKWKVALIEEVDRNIAKEPMILPGKINMSALPDFAFRRVLLKGRFVGPAMLQGPQTRDGVPGYHVIVPFDRSDSGGSTILVNKGFVKTAEGDEIKRGLRPVPGLALDGGPGPEVVVEGMLTKADPYAKSYFTPDNEIEAGNWYWKDIAAMTEYAGGETKNVQPVLIDVIDRESEPASLRMVRGEPVGRFPSVDLRNQHLSYAITWFSLCAATAVMLGMVVTKGRTKKLPKRRAFGEK